MSFDTQESSTRSGQPVDLYRFSSGLSNVFLLTSADQKFVHLAETYVPEAIKRTAVKEGRESDAGSVVVSLPASHPIGALFIGYSPEPPMDLVVTQKHRNDPGTSELFDGVVASARFTGAIVELSCRPSFAGLKQRIPPNTCQAQCNWALYSGHCGVVRASFQVTGAASAVSADTVQAAVFGSKPDGWFNNGWVERVTGERRFIVGHAGATLTLMSPFLGLVVGETLTAFAGCDRSEAVCLSKFANSARFLGFPRVPTKNPFEVGIG